MTPLSIDLELILIFITVIANLALGFLVFGKGGKRLSNKIFFILCLSIIFWTISNYFSLHPFGIAILFWIRIVLFFAVFMQFMFFFFVHVFPKDEITLSKIKFIGLVILTISAMIATLSPYVFVSTEIKNGQVIPVPGPLIPLFALTIITFFVFGAYFIIKKYRAARGIEKAQLRYVLIGFLTMFSLLILTQFIFVVVLQNTTFVNFGPIFTLPFIIFATYAIIKHHLFNIRVIATELFTAFIAVTLLVNVLFSTNLQELIIRSILFLLVLIFGYFLILGTLREVRELERISAAKSEFISIASHQLRSPLAAIKGYISMILEGSFGKVDTGIGRVLKNVYQSNERLIKLVEDLLNLSRIEEGRMIYDFREISIEDTVKSIAEELKPLADQKGIQISWHGTKERLPEIKGDINKLRQVILNLIDNAIRYTDKGDVDINIAFSQKNKIIVAVKDTGIGMNQEEIKNLFERFHRGSEISQIHPEGIGLGLYVAKKIVEAHGGRIWAESEGKGRGSTFFVELPLSYNFEKIWKEL